MNDRRLAIVGVVLVVVGLGAALLPATWIEDAAGVEPDGGSGGLELLIALGVVAVGASFLATAYIRAATQRRHVREPEASGH